MKRIIVAGSRTFDDYALLEREVKRLTRKLKQWTLLSGGAKGADKLAEQYAFKHWRTVPTTKVYHPDYNKYGKIAPLKRNQEMVNEADFLIAFWDGKSTGTADIIGRARNRDIEIRIIRFDQE